MDETPPLIEAFVELEKKDYKQLILDNNIKPIKRRKPIQLDIHCPCCNAPFDYLYDNNGKLYQFECKVCAFIYTKDYIPPNDKDVILKCPNVF